MFELIIAAFLIWFFAGRHIGRLNDRLGKAESAIRDLELMQRRADGAALPPVPAAEEPTPAEPVPDELPPAAERAPVETAVPIAPLPPEPEPVAAAAAVSSAPGFEERIGTRWAVWVGGAALAVGGIFLVNYSIEQGWI